MTQHNGEIELSFNEYFACQLIGRMKVDKEHPESYAVPVCMRNKIIMRIANLLTDGRAIELVYCLMSPHVDEDFESNFDNLTEFCWSLELNS